MDGPRTPAWPGSIQLANMHVICRKHAPQALSVKEVAGTKGVDMYSMCAVYVWEMNFTPPDLQHSFALNERDVDGAELPRFVLTTE